MAAFLEDVQARAYALLSLSAPQGFFLRRSRGHHCLWLSDLPRRAEAEVLAATAALDAEGFCCTLREGLLEIDLSLARVEAMLATLPQAIPALPEEERFHPAYALCRLLFLHPAPLEEQPLEPLRAVLKATASPEVSETLSLIPGLHEQCAAWLREGRKLPHAAGRALAAWLAGQAP